MLTWALFEELFSLEFVFIFDLPLYGMFAFLSCYSARFFQLLEFLENSCGEFYLLLENFSE